MKPFFRILSCASALCFCAHAAALPVVQSVPDIRKPRPKPQAPAAAPAADAQAPAAANPDNKYEKLAQIINCPRDGAQFGNFSDQGRFNGGIRCGQSAKPGYYVWAAPNWYAWERLKGAQPESYPPEASAKGKYSGHLLAINCPKDGAQYGNFHDFGYWEGTVWCGQKAEAGYWVYAAPNWHVWSSKTGK